MRSEAVDEFWAEFCSADGSVNRDTRFQIWYFGNTPEMAAELAGLVMSGKKTATASLVRVNELNPEDAPLLDGLSVVTDFHGNPLCVLKTTEVREVRFDDVDAEFAADEGEGDLSLEYWRRVHSEYFTREAKSYGFKFNDDSLVCCERFKLLFPR